MRMEGYAVQHCRAIRCPFESICRNRDFHTDRSHGCETQNYIINEAQKLKPVDEVSVTEPIISDAGMTKIRMLKLLREKTGVDLKTAKDALEYSGWDLIGAQSYLKYGW